MKNILPSTTATITNILQTNPVLRALYLKSQICRASDLLVRAHRNNRSCPNQNAAIVRRSVNGAKGLRSNREIKTKAVKLPLNRVSQAVLAKSKAPVQRIAVPTVEMTIGTDPLVDVAAAIAAIRSDLLRSFTATVLYEPEVQALLSDAMVGGRSMPARILFRAAHSCREQAELGYWDREVLYVATHLQGLSLLYAEQQRKRDCANQINGYTTPANLRGAAPSDWMLAIVQSALRQLDAHEGLDALGEPLPSPEGQLLRLCMGWIDGAEAQGDEVEYLQTLPLKALQNQGLVQAPTRINY
ncbi:MAG: hypothetical protein ABIZ09_06580 [Rhodoferax sp.]